ncbi:MAG: hypothetical protein IPQ07_38895 [Myxococcales bacterium]|nr:hypothetical protein [Myxococcales bacterium]
MRTSLGLVLLIAGCHPSATVEKTMPVASLGSYRTVSVRVHSSAFAAQGQAMYLEAQVLEKVRQKCGFERVDRADGGAADVLIDLNITGTGHGGGGWVSNSSTATVDTLLVLTDGQDGQLLGAAKIRGKSSGMIINNAPPENEATGAVAKSVAELLAKSGCTGPRIAKVVDPVVTPPDTGSGGSGSAAIAPPDESHRAEAEAKNDLGKEKLYAADYAGALGAFQAAFSLVPDPKYQFSICIVFGVQEQWDTAVAACQKAKSMNPPPALAAKIDRRIEQLQQRK